MNTTTLTLQDRLNLFPSDNNPNDNSPNNDNIISDSVSLIQLTKQALKDNNFRDDENTAILFYESLITAANSFTINKRKKEASKAFYEAGMMAATLYFTHREWMYGGKAVNALKNFLKHPCNFKKNKRRAQKTLDTLYKQR